MKSSAQRVVGIVTSVMVGLIIQSRAQERTVLVSELRVGNVATQPGQAWYGDFEYDIGTNTAAPAATGQFAWPNSNAVPFEITYDANVKYAWLQVSSDPDHNIRYDLGSAPFTPDALTTLRFGGRATQLNSSIRVTNLVLEVEGQAAVALTNVFEVLPVDGYKSGMLSGLPLSQGFKLRGDVLLAWTPPNLPARGHLAVQISATEPAFFDLDVDSDNNNGRNPPDLSAAEDAMETNTPGKFVFANVNDDDNDGVTDFADATVTGENNLVPVVLRASPWLDWANTTIRFDYPGPTALDLPAYTGHNLGSGFTNYTGAATNNLPANTTTALRLWNITGPDATKAANTYLVPGQTYTASELAFTGSSTFYMEGILPGFTNLVATLTQGATILSDTVVVTVVYANLGVNNSNNSHDEDPTTRDSLRPGMPDVQFDIDEHDEMLEDQGDGFRFWWSRDSGATVTMNGIVDLAPLSLDIPPELVSAGFRFYLRADEGSLNVFPSVSSGNTRLRHLQNPAVADSQISQTGISLSDGTAVQIAVGTGGPREFLFRGNGNGTVRARLSLLVEEPAPSQNRTVADSARVTFAETRDLWMLVSSRTYPAQVGGPIPPPSIPFAYTNEVIGGTPHVVQIQRYPTAVQRSGNRDGSKRKHLIWLHGYNVSEAEAQTSFDEIYRRLFWIGFRGNFIGLTWEGNEGNFATFDSNVENAFQSSPSVSLWLRSVVQGTWSIPATDIDMVAHSLGNLVMFDALRLSRHDGGGPLVNNVASLESATWPEAYERELAIGSIVYGAPLDPPPDSITYGNLALRVHTWAFWFGQSGAAATDALRGDVFHSYLPSDVALGSMRLNDYVQRAMPVEIVPPRQRRSHYHRDRVPGFPANRSPAPEPAGHPNLYNDVPTLLIPGARRENYDRLSLNLPVGTQFSPASTYDYLASDGGWLPASNLADLNSHSRYLSQPFPTIFRWYDEFLGSGIGFPTAIAIGED